MKFPYKWYKKTFVEAVISENNSLKSEIGLATTFIKAIEDGNLAVNFNESNDVDHQNSILETALLSMQTKMKNFSEMEFERNWFNEGMAKFGDILRSNQDNPQLLYDAIIDGLVKYLNANQGGLFLINNDHLDDTYIELVACYAYSRKKFLEKKIGFGEGLIGQCYIEKETIYLTEVPQNYLSITSGLGDASPKCVLIVPLKTNEITFGLVELASFTVLEPYQVQFVEKIGESIASTLANTKNNARTKKLLEEAQIQEEQLRAQEEEMRQNMEEIQATQEEMYRKEAQLEQIVLDTKKKEAEITAIAQKHQEEIENLNAELERLNLQLKRKDKKIEELESLNK